MAAYERHQVIFFASLDLCRFWGKYRSGHSRRPNIHDQLMIQSLPYFDQLLELGQVGRPANVIYTLKLSYVLWLSHCSKPLDILGQEK